MNLQMMDQTTENGLIKRLKVEYRNDTFILVTQKLKILDLIDRVIVMHDSKIFLDGSKDEVINKLGSV